MQTIKEANINHNAKFGALPFFFVSSQLNVAMFRASASFYLLLSKKTKPLKRIYSKVCFFFSKETER